MKIRKVHIGNVIKKEMRSRRLSASLLAGRLKRPQNSIYRIWMNENINTAMLAEISEALGRNFFEEWVVMPTVDEDLRALLTERTQRYEKEIEDLKTELLEKKLEWAEREIEYLKGLKE